ncbi:hypothetical protein D210916BOD24_02130 [Alteromonas sp. D210916BOD_24]|uniref:DUF3703 domain-containing protein n=1 Tax=Alteromonas sp. D210916BOD_24 TaxID=3157618 RepID=UPI00399C6D39
MATFTQNIAFAVLREVVHAKRMLREGKDDIAFTHLENAHVLGQASTRWHVYIHVLMLMWGIRQRKPKEVVGQLLRIGGAATKTAIGLVPTGNTGGSNISPFKTLPVSSKFQAKIAKAKL